MHTTSSCARPLYTDIVLYDVLSFLDLVRYNTHIFIETLLKILQFHIFSPWNMLKKKKYGIEDNFELRDCMGLPDCAKFDNKSWSIADIVHKFHHKTDCVVSC